MPGFLGMNTEDGWRFDRIAVALSFLTYLLSATVRINHKTRLCVLSMTSSDLEVTPVNICHGVSGVQLVGAKKSTFKCLSPPS